jgi:hypothetical protein
VRFQFLNSVFTDYSSLLSLWVSGYGLFEWFQCLYLQQSNCPLKLKSDRSFWNTRNRQSPNSAPTHPRSVHPQDNGCENWVLHNGRQRLSPSSNDVVRSKTNSSWYMFLFCCTELINISWQLRDFRLPPRYKRGHRSSVDRWLLTDISGQPIGPSSSVKLSNETPWSLDLWRRTETSVTTDQHCLTSQNSEDLSLLFIETKPDNGILH